MLREIHSMLTEFSLGIRLRAASLDELLRTSEGEFPKNVIQRKNQTNDLRDAWNAACGILGKTREAALLRDLGREFGNSDREGILRLVEITDSEIKILLTEAEERYSRKGRAFAQLGALCGAAVAILII